MKYSFLFFLATLLLLSACNNTANNIAANKRMQSLLDQKDYFRLQAQLNLLAADDDEKFYFASFIDNAFNRNEDCIKDVAMLLQKYPHQFADSTKFVLARL